MYFTINGTKTKQLYDGRLDSWQFHFNVKILGRLFIHMCLCHQYGPGRLAVMRWNIAPLLITP